MQMRKIIKIKYTKTVFLCFIIKVSFFSKLMSFTRVIPKLDIKGPNLIKAIEFDGHRVLGKVEDFADIYYKEGADELIYQDIDDLRMAAHL